MTFTVVVFHGLDRLGIPYRKREAHAYMHAWCVIGHLIGIQPDLLPIDRAEGERLALLIAGRHHKPSEAGTRLTEALLRYMEVSMPLGLRKLPRTMMRRMLPRPVPDLLGVPAAAWWSPAVTAMSQVGPVLGHIPGGRQVLQAPTATVGRAVLRTVVDRGLTGEQPSFRLDPAVVDRLSLRTSALRRSMRARRRRIRRDRAAR